MNKHQLIELIPQLLEEGDEREWLEFKDSYYKPQDIGEYLSALANSAYIHGRENGYLIFGVENRTNNVVGTSFRFSTKKKGNQPLEFWLNQLLQPKIGFDVHEFEYQAKPIVLIFVKAAISEPVRFNGEAYVRIGSNKTKLKNYPELERRIWTTASRDWSSGICAGATCDDLDPRAIVAARHNFFEKNRNKEFAEEIDSWPNPTFLDRARLTKDGAITRACMLLLGREEAVHHLNPAVAQLTWKLEGEERAYEHFGPPFLVSTNELYSRIRNTTQKIDVPGHLIPLEVPKYDKWVVLEALHNAIAHQDYSAHARVIVTEQPDCLLFESMGNFFEGHLEDYTTGGKTPQRYRNRFLADAMVNINMIDTMGYGIHRMYVEQRKRYYPLPDYDITEPNKVVVTVHGKIIDPNYTALLMKQEDLPLGSVILLDRIQKRFPVSKDQAKLLRQKRLVEGRYPSLYVAAHIASATGDKAQYIKNRAFDDEHYKQLILNYLKQYGKVTKKEIEQLLIEKLSDVLSPNQKRSKVKNLLSVMSKRDRMIRCIGSGRRWYWVLDLDERSGT